ncbi:uncharacterized protein ISCGN_023138 [Ixodes scapularis]
MEPFPYFRVYDFEAILEAENRGQAYGKHVPSSFCILVIRSTDSRIVEQFLYRGEDCVEKFISILNQLSKLIGEGIRSEEVPMSGRPVSTVRSTRVYGRVDPCLRSGRPASTVGSTRVYGRVDPCLRSGRPVSTVGSTRVYGRVNPTTDSMVQSGRPDPTEYGTWVKKELAASKTAIYAELALWRRSVENHLYWVAASSEGDPRMIVPKWLSILNHVRDIHEHSNPLYPVCAHVELEPREWLDDGRAQGPGTVNGINGNADVFGRPASPVRSPFLGSSASCTAFKPQGGCSLISVHLGNGAHGTASKPQSRCCCVSIHLRAGYDLPCPTCCFGPSGPGPPISDLCSSEEAWGAPQAVDLCRST